jgi:DNA-binding NarL/FixJ family response regulator
MSAGKNGRLSVLLFDQQALLRRLCFAQFLEVNGFRVRSVAVEDCGTVERLLAPDDPAIDLVVIDTGDEGCRCATAQTIFECLHHHLPTVPIVVISDRHEWAHVAIALQLGARAYFPSSLDPKILIETLRFVRNGGTFVPPSVLMSAPEPRLPQSAEAKTMQLLGITERELRVLELLQKGQSNKIIARELDIEEGTVKVHVHRIMKKLNASNRTQAALLARQMVEATGFDRIGPPFLGEDTTAPHRL